MLPYIQGLTFFKHNQLIYKKLKLYQWKFNDTFDWSKSADMDPSKQPHEKNIVPETPQPIKQFGTKEFPKPDTLPDPHHLILVEYRIASKFLDTKLLSIGVLLIRASSSYAELWDTIRCRRSNWGSLPSEYEEKSIAVRWNIGQAVNDDSYDTLCGPDTSMERLIIMMRERHWRDRLVVVYEAKEDSVGGVSSEPKNRNTSPILGQPSDGE